VCSSDLEKETEGITAIGAKVVYNGQYSALGEATWRPFAEAIKSAGVKGLVYVGEPASYVKLMQAFSDIGYQPEWVSPGDNHLDAAVLTGGKAAEHTYVRSVFYSFLDPELAKKNQATQDYLDLMKQFNPGGKVAYLGVSALSAWLLFATAARDCGADVTRDCVYAKARENTAWTGGGLQGAGDVKNRKGPICWGIYEVKGGKFVVADYQKTPGKGIYNCDEKNFVALKKAYGTGEKCPNPAFATDPKPSNCANK